MSDAEKRKADWVAYEEFIRALGHDPDSVTKVLIANGAIIVDSVAVHPLGAE